MAEKRKEKMPQGRYQVWHNGADGFVPVANVQAGNLLAALVLTINRTDAPWAENEHVVALLPNARSTDFGDVVVNSEGVAYQVQKTRHGLVFAMVDFPPQREQKALFAEWELDYAAARSRDRKVAFGQSLGGSPEPRQAVNDKQKIRDGGRER